MPRRWWDGARRRGRGVRSSFQKIHRQTATLSHRVVVAHSALRVGVQQVAPHHETRALYKEVPGLCRCSRRRSHMFETDEKLREEIERSLNDCMIDGRFHLVSDA